MPEGPLHGDDVAAGRDQARGVEVPEVVQSLLLPETAGKAYALESTEGDGPGKDLEQWRSLFASVA